MFNSPSFAISTYALFPLNVTLDNVTVPELLITASPLLFVNVTFVTSKLPPSCTVIAFVKPEYSLISDTFNVYVLVFIPLALVVLVNILLLPSISKSALNVSYVLPPSSIHAVR